VSHSVAEKRAAGGLEAEASEAEAFVTEKVKAMQGHRLSFLRIQKSDIARRIPPSIA